MPTKGLCRNCRCKEKIANGWVHPPLKDLSIDDQLAGMCPAVAVARLKRIVNNAVAAFEARFGWQGRAFVNLLRLTPRDPEEPISKNMAATLRYISQAYKWPFHGLAYFISKALEDRLLGQTDYKSIISLANTIWRMNEDGSDVTGPEARVVQSSLFGIKFKCDNRDWRGYLDVDLIQGFKMAVAATDYENNKRTHKLINLGFLGSVGLTVKWDCVLVPKLLLEDYPHIMDAPTTLVDRSHLDIRSLMDRHCVVDARSHKDIRNLMDIRSIVDKPGFAGSTQARTKRWLDIDHLRPQPVPLDPDSSPKNVTDTDHIIQQGNLASNSEPAAESYAPEALDFGLIVIDSDESALSSLSGTPQSHPDSYSERIFQSSSNSDSDFDRGSSLPKKTELEDKRVVARQRSVSNSDDEPLRKRQKSNRRTVRSPTNPTSPDSNPPRTEAATIEHPTPPSLSLSASIPKVPSRPSDAPFRYAIHHASAKARDAQHSSTSALDKSPNAKVSVRLRWSKECEKYGFDGDEGYKAFEDAYKAAEDAAKRDLEMGEDPAPYHIYGQFDRVGKGPGARLQMKIVTVTEALVMERAIEEDEEDIDDG
ncbi:MAG: hypothetical protein M1814_005105 [Vezdaea aestivalis]|nr:MAG: hypothetical protein M1814_005105 [Vezdaea aestivalis]